MAAGAFALDLSRLCEGYKGNIARVVQKTVIDLGEAVVAKTPVGDPTTWKMPAPAGYVGGRARGSWQYGFNTPTAGEGGIDSSGGSANARIVAGATAHQAPGVHYITSTVPYMRRLEYDAWSKQAPEGMVRRTVIEFRDFIEANAREVKK